MTAPRLRPARAEDGAGCAAIYAPVVRDTPISFELEPPGPQEMARRIAAAAPDLPWLVCCEGEALIGYAYAARHRARAAYRFAAEVSVYGHPAARRRGVGRALYAALLEVLALQGFRRALAGITLPNPASVGLHEACGFTPVGVYHRVGFKAGAWWDVGWWERALGASPDPPDAPRPFAEIARGAEVAGALSAAAAQIRPR